MMYVTYGNNILHNSKMKMHFSICRHTPQHAYLNILMESSSFFFKKMVHKPHSLYCTIYLLYINALDYNFFVKVCRSHSSSIFRIIEQHHCCNTIFIIIDDFILFLLLHI